MGTITPSPWDDVAEWWDREAGESGVWHQQNDIDPVVWRTLGRARGKKILEIGCGNGYFSRRLARAGATVTACDISTTFIRLAQQNELRRHYGIRFLQRDAANLKGLNRANYDVVLSNMMLMDVRRYRSAIKEASRVLKHGGRLVFSIIHPLYSDWQHQVVTYKGRKYYARILKKYLSETDTDRAHWKIGHDTVHYHRPLQSYVHVLHDAGMCVSDLHEVPTKRKLVRAPSEEKRITNKLTKYYISSRDKAWRQFTQKEIPLFLVVEAVKTS